MVRGGGDAANLRSSGLWFAVAFGGAGVGRNRRQRKDAWTGLCGWKEPRCVADLLSDSSEQLDVGNETGYRMISDSIPENEEFFSKVNDSVNRDNDESPES
nr:myosin-1-like isoform X3 [Ipomoea batatas]